MTDWKPVTGRDGAILGYMAGPDPGEADVDWFEADRLPKVRRRAAAINEAAALIPDPSFDMDAAYASGRLGWGELDAASYVALVLTRVELSGEGE